MSAASAQVAFTAEFILFLVAVAGAAFGALRGELLVEGRGRRAWLGVGFALVAASALVHGSLLEPDAGSALVAGPRLVGLAALAWASLRPAAPGPASVSLLVGLAVLALAEVAVVGDATSVLTDVVRIAGAVTLGASLLSASRRSIAARVAAGAAATVLTVVLAVSVTLSGVLVDNVRDEVLRRTDTRAAAEVNALDDREDRAQSTVGSITKLLTGNDSARAVLLELLNPDASVATPAGLRLKGALDSLGTTLLPQGMVLAFVVAREPDRPVISGPGDLTSGQLAQLPFLDVVDDALTSGGAAQGFEVLGRTSLAVAAGRVDVTDKGEPIFAGVVVVAERVDPTYLRNRGIDDADLSLGVADRSGLLAVAGPQPEAGPLQRLVRQVYEDDEPVARSIGGRFVSGHPIQTSGGTVAVLVASSPSRLADETRDSLFGTLFLVALAGTLVAIVLASVLGGRIGRALRRLTDAAGEIQEGNLDARVGLDQPDELGVLGTAFERMAVSLRTMTDELREAAIDEARLRGRLEAVVGGMGEALVAVDAEGKVIEFNAAAERLFGRTASSVRGRPVGRLPLVGPNGDDLAARITRTEGGPWSGEASVPARGGAVPVIVTAAPLRGPTGESAGSVALLRDTRREREIERMKTDFLSNISHEMKTPLTPIKGYARMLSEREIPPERAREFAGEIAIGASQLERVINQLVNFATMAAGRLEPEPAPVTARDLLEDVLGRWSDRIGPDHELERRVSRGTPSLHVDRQLVAMSLDELVDNALKYSPDGGRITLQARSGAPGTVEVSVTDRGVGLDEFRLETIFEDFAQGDASSTRRFGGLGLGLPMVRHVARAHGGDVEVTSTPGRGATFTLTLPAVTG